MSNINVMRKNLGPVTAYKYAVSKGFTGTEEEFAELMASYASIAQDVSAESRVAEGYALGKQNGVDVGDQSPYYHANAKYHAEQAAAKAQEAAQSAAQAESAITVDPTLTHAGQAADAKVVGDKIEGIKGELTEIKPSCFNFNYAFNEKYVRYIDGVKTNSVNFSCTNFIPVDGIEKILYTRMIVTSSNPSHGIAFFSDAFTNSFISGVASKSGIASGSEMYEVDVPPGAKYVQCSWWSEELRVEHGDFKIYDGTQYYNSFVQAYPILVDTKFNDVNKMLLPVNLADGVSFIPSAVKHRDGTLYISSGFVGTDYIYIGNCTSIEYTRIVTTRTQIPDHGMAFYNQNKQYIGGYASLYGEAEAGNTISIITVPEDAIYARFSVRSDNTANFVLYNHTQAVESFEARIAELEEKQDGSDGALAITNADVLDSIEFLMSKTDGQKNAVARMRLLTDIQWTPILPVPKQYRIDGTLVYGSFPAGETVKGIPYASQLKYELWMGKSISFETFLSALKNPNSVIYSFARMQESGLYRPGAWYSIVCSKAVSFALGIKTNYATGAFASDPNIRVIAQPGNYTAYDIVIGDLLEKPETHTALVTDIIYDVFGDISQIEVGEAVTPSCRRKKWNIYGNVDNFFTHFDGYKLERYDLLSNVTPVDLTSLVPYISNTIGLNYGNKANYLPADTKNLTILKKIGDEITIIKDDELVDTIDVSNNTEGDVIPLSLTTAGYYTINFTDKDDKDAVELCISDALASFDNATNKLIFTATVGILYNVSFATSRARSHISDVFPTAEDISNGYMTLVIPNNAAYIHVFFKTNFGVLRFELSI